MELAGSAANPPLVVMQGLKTAVLFRGPEANADDVREVLEQYNRTQVDLLVDLKQKYWQVLPVGPTSFGRFSE